MFFNRDDLPAVYRELITPGTHVHTGKREPYENRRLRARLRFLLICHTYTRIQCACARARGSIINNTITRALEDGKRGFGFFFSLSFFFFFFKFTRVVFPRKPRREKRAAYHNSILSPLLLLLLLLLSLIKLLLLLLLFTTIYWYLYGLSTTTKFPNGGSLKNTVFGRHTELMCLEF